MHYNIFLDDVRVPKDVVWVKLPLVEWTIIRNYNDFVKYITLTGLPSFVTFDHDLADEHYRPSMYAPDGHYNNYYTDGTFKERTGYDCAKWLVNYCMEKNLKVPQYTVHSMNPVGKNNIINYIEGYKKSNE